MALWPVTFMEQSMMQDFNVQLYCYISPDAKTVFGSSNDEDNDEFYELGRKPRDLVPTDQLNQSVTPTVSRTMPPAIPKLNASIPSYDQLIKVREINDGQNKSNDQNTNEVVNAPVSVPTPIPEPTPMPASEPVPTPMVTQMSAQEPHHRKESAETTSEAEDNDDEDYEEEDKNTPVPPITGPTERARRERKPIILKEQLVDGEREYLLMYPGGHRSWIPEKKMDPANKK